MIRYFSYLFYYATKKPELLWEFVRMNGEATIVYGLLAIIIIGTIIQMIFRRFTKVRLLDRFTKWGRANRKVKKNWEKATKDNYNESYKRWL